MGQKIQGKLITQAMNGTSVANRCNHQSSMCSKINLSNEIEFMMNEVKSQFPKVHNYVMQRLKCTGNSVPPKPPGFVSILHTPPQKPTEPTESENIEPEPH